MPTRTRSERGATPRAEPTLEVSTPEVSTPEGDEPPRDVPRWAETEPLPDAPQTPGAVPDPGSPRRTPARPALDPAAAAAVDVAAVAAHEVGGQHVGEHLEAVADGPRVVTHYFDATLPGYRGWRWAVTVVRAARAKLVTVDEVVLLPGPDALLAPEWVPWSERVEPGDLRVGDLLPPEPDDDRLVPAYVESDDPAVEGVATELGLGRVRVMSRLGRTETAERWHDGDTGPGTAMAAHAPAQCGTCGFYLPIEGSLRAAFGVCGNEFAPTDGRVVVADYGCGAHSEVLSGLSQPAAAPEELPFDDAALDFQPRWTPSDRDDHDAAGGDGDVDTDASEEDELGHS